jgi:hypothetical protein
MMPGVGLGTLGDMLHPAFRTSTQIRDGAIAKFFAANGTTMSYRNRGVTFMQFLSKPD